MDFKYTRIDELDANIIAVDVMFSDAANGRFFRQWITDNHPEMDDFVVAVETADGIDFLGNREGEYYDVDLNGIPQEDWSEHTWGDDENQNN